MIGITFALTAESVDFRRLLTGRRDVLSDGVGNGMGNRLRFFTLASAKKFASNALALFCAPNRSPV
jgi:hypothetical protein